MITLVVCKVSPMRQPSGAGKWVAARLLPLSAPAANVAGTVRPAINFISKDHRHPRSLLHRSIKKTLHNWLRPRDEHVTQNRCQSAIRERLAKYVKYKASSFLYLFLFFPRTRLLKSPVHGFWRTIAQNTCCDVRKCLLGSTRWPATLWDSNFPKTIKNGLLQGRSSVREWTQDEWRHWRAPSLARRHWWAACTIYNIWGVTAAVYFPVIKHYIRYGNSVLASATPCTTGCRQPVVQGVA